MTNDEGDDSYGEGRPELVAYGLTVLTLIGLGILLTTIVLNWIIGPTLAVLLVVGYTPLCRKAMGRK